MASLNYVSREVVCTKFAHSRGMPPPTSQCSPCSGSATTINSDVALTCHGSIEPTASHGFQNVTNLFFRVDNNSTPDSEITAFPLRSFSKCHHFCVRACMRPYSNKDTVHSIGYIALTKQRSSGKKMSRRVTLDCTGTKRTPSLPRQRPHHQRLGRKYLNAAGAVVVHHGEVIVLVDSIPDRHVPASSAVELDRSILVLPIQRGSLERCQFRVRIPRT